MFSSSSVIPVVYSYVYPRPDILAIVYSLFCDFCSEGFPFSLEAWDRLHYLIAVHPGHSI